MMVRRSTMATAHDIQDYGDIATTAGMTFDELFPDNHSTPTMDIDVAVVPNLEPVTPCFSDETSTIISITGTFRNIEESYHVNPHILGTGHHGSVRKCIHRTTGQGYAVKSIRKSDPAVMPGGLAREIMLLQEMKHSNIVQLVEVFEDAEYVHLITDLFEGGELFDKIVDKASVSNCSVPCFEETEAARIIHQVLMAVCYMHDRGIAHRDIKPENILFETKDDENSSVKIVDFGLARKHHASSHKRVEPPMSTVVGTPYYIAPEVLKRRYNKSCDLWSIGVITYILLCGYPPFNGDDNDQVYDSVRRGIYRFPSEDWSGSSHESRDFVRRLLQMDPRRRMTARQALDHPWIVKNVVNVGGVATMVVEEDRQDTSGVAGAAGVSSSVEVVFRELERRESIICRDNPPAIRKCDDDHTDDVRKVLFADF